MSEADSEGFLKDPATWSEQHALAEADRLAIRLTEDHWKIILAAREFYLNTGVSPSMRPLVNVAKQVEPRLGSSLMLAKLFTSNTSKVVAQLSGTPKPSDCV
ncbi:MAG: TusE/DsrC/DsvC family sulfur relay protein [Gammaproteobacteria bacterium]|nr:TusE/DsrC/DsvC family sulfur relay protein [Gammaproteobacteria bacterium]